MDALILLLRYGCPGMEEIENFSCLYKKQLDEIGERGEIPMDLALEVNISVLFFINAKSSMKNLMLSSLYFSFRAATISILS